MSGKIYPAVAAAGVTFVPTGAGAASTGSTTSGSVLVSLTGVIDCALTTAESSEMSSFLADFRNVLGNWKKRKVGLDSVIPRLESYTLVSFVRLVTTFYACPNYWILSAIRIIMWK